MFKIKNVSVVNNWSDFYANVSDEMLKNENYIRVHVTGSNEILNMCFDCGEYVVDVIDTDTYLNVNCLAFNTYNELVEAVEVAYGELL